MLAAREEETPEVHSRCAAAPCTRLRSSGLRRHRKAEEAPGLGHPTTTSNEAKILTLAHGALDEDKYARAAYAALGKKKRSPPDS